MLIVSRLQRGTVEAKCCHQIWNCNIWIQYMKIWISSLNYLKNWMKLIFTNWSVKSRYSFSLMNRNFTNGGMEKFSSQISTIDPPPGVYGGRAYRGIWKIHQFILSMCIIFNTNNVKHKMTGVEDDFPYIWHSLIPS